MKIVSNGAEHGAYLQQIRSGRVLLCLDNTSYLADDMIPSGNKPPEALHQNGNARKFVSLCMIVAYDRDETGWPQLAKEFLAERRVAEVRKPYLMHLS